ncbi:MAG: ATP-binding protein [Lentisphaerae bacterium]|nr:ATP-binding protein [Lentisphaerota bacterium]MCP4101145.1 ATP-binding protein [Lentisphaerota bacterium]
MEKRVFKIMNNFAELENVCIEANTFMSDNSFPKESAYTVALCLEEMGTNIIKYGYDDNDEHEIKVNLELNAELARLQLMDDGHEFNPLLVGPADVTSDISHRQVGGMGIHLTRSMASNIYYRRLDDTNVLTIEVVPVDK